MDEPESTAALQLASRERLDNCIFVVNCNLQRLMAPCAAMVRSSQSLKIYLMPVAGESLKSGGVLVGISFGH